MTKALLVYYNFGEVPKIINKLEELFKNKNIEVKKEEVRLKEEIEIKRQFKKEKKLILNNKINSLKNVEWVIVGTPIVSFTSVPAINVFIRSLPDLKNRKVVLFATGIGLPGRAIKKMSSLLSMKNGKVVSSQVFSSIFEFDSKKLREVDSFFEKFISNTK